jgi:hypothetical protein
MGDDRCLQGNGDDNVIQELASLIAAMSEMNKSTSSLWPGSGAIAIPWKIGALTGRSRPYTCRSTKAHRKLFTWYAADQ